MTRQEKHITRNLDRAQKLYAHVFTTNPFSGRDAVLDSLDSAIQTLRHALALEKQAPARHRKVGAE